MTPSDHDDVIKSTIAALSTSGDDALTKAVAEGIPDRGEVIEWTERTRALVLLERDRSVLRSELPYLAERLEKLIARLPLPDGKAPRALVAGFLQRLPAVRQLLAEDVEAAFEGDPAARSYAEIVVSYPALHAVATYRIAHELYRLGVPILPRMMTEHSHDRTGIDINPGARIGRRLFIDHGTGVVIGETSQIGDNVRIYQGVTLGARSPRQGEVLRGVKRHPTIEDDVVIYAGATILGGETVIGRGSVIGGNVWLVDSVPEDSKVTLEPPRLRVRQRPGPGGSSDPNHWDV
ncbi:MAG TPA: serine O-acetyltransferase EpsC [Myxococcota bacterium]